MIVLACLGLAFVCFASLCAHSFRDFSRHQLEELCDWSGKKEYLRRIIKNYERMEIAANTTGMIALVFSFACGIAYFLPHLKSIQFLDISSRLTYLGEFCALVLGASLVTLFVSVWIPSALSQLWATHFVYFTFRFWVLVAAILYPLERIHYFFITVFQRLAGYHPETSEEEQFEEEIRTIVTEGHREGLLEEDAREMIESVIELADVCVSEIMTPRTDTICIPFSLSWDEMLALAITIPHSRIPVFDENKDDIVGVLFIKDLLPELVKEPQQRKKWTDLLRTPLFVPETKPVDKLLQEFQNSTQPEEVSTDEQPDQQADQPRQSRHMHIAIVLDEYGGVSGLVTLEDILEEIVGEIIDEHDLVDDNEDILQKTPQEYEVLGKVHLDELNERLDIGLPEEEDFDTIGGYVFSTLGHVPHVGESLFFEKENKRFKLTVLKATKRRVERVRIEMGVTEPSPSHD